MNTPPASSPPRRSVWRTLRLVACGTTGVVFLTASGCPFVKREQEGDADIVTAVYEVRVSPSTAQIAPASLDAAVPDIPLTIAGVCSGIFDPGECASFSPGWTGQVRTVFGLRGLTINIDSPDSSVSAATIKVTSAAQLFESMRIPGSLTGYQGLFGFFPRPTRPLPSGFELKVGRCAVNVIHPGGTETREDAAAEQARLSAPRALRFVPQSGQTRALAVQLKYTGPATRLADAAITGSHASQYVPAFPLGIQIGGEHSDYAEGTVTYTMNPALFVEAKATLTVTTENGASVEVHCTGWR